MVATHKKIQKILEDPWAHSEPEFVRNSKETNFQKARILINRDNLKSSKSEISYGKKSDEK